MMKNKIFYRIKKGLCYNVYVGEQSLARTVEYLRLIERILSRRI